MGEFIFDNAWAEAAFRANIEYYPKILVAVPFTPASGARVLVKAGLSKPVQDEIRRMVGVFLKELAEANDFSSVHVNFCEESEGACKRVLVVAGGWQGRVEARCCVSCRPRPLARL